MRTIVDHPFADGLPDEWAVEWGQDEYGVFQSFAIKGVVQRMRWIEPGRFWMGSPENERGRFEWEIRHEVVLTDGYWLAETPCTQALWEAVMGNNPSGFKGDDRRPVEQVSWEDCQLFLAKVRGLLPSRSLGFSDGEEFRLPTEAEWERGCRGGTEGATWLGELELDGERRSRVVEEIAWYAGNSKNRTHPVGKKAPNPFGLRDMLGNVYEWCADCKREYGATLVVDPVGPVGGDRRVMRGGAWNYHAGGCRAAFRYWGEPGYRSDFLGFRIARGRTPRSESGQELRNQETRQETEPLKGTRSGPVNRDAGRGPVAAPTWDAPTPASQTTTTSNLVTVATPPPQETTPPASTDSTPEPPIAKSFFQRVLDFFRPRK